MTKLEERVREAAAATPEEGKRSTERLPRKGRHAVEDSVEEATHRIKRDPFMSRRSVYYCGTGATGKLTS